MNNDKFNTLIDLLKKEDNWVYNEALKAYVLETKNALAKLTRSTMEATYYLSIEPPSDGSPFEPTKLTSNPETVARFLSLWLHCEQCQNEHAAERGLAILAGLPKTGVTAKQKQIIDLKKFVWNRDCFGGYNNGRDQGAAQLACEYGIITLVVGLGGPTSGYWRVSTRGQPELAPQLQELWDHVTKKW